MLRLHVLIAILIFGYCRLSIAQGQVDGVVLDADTNEPIPYVNIGIIKQLRGTVSSTNGQFKLRFESDADTVLFSAIGFQSVKSSIRDLLNNPALKLEKTTYRLEEIVVNERPLGNLKDLGYNLRKRGHSIGFGSTQLGTEIGGLIEIDRETVIYSARFIFNSTADDKLLFRVNVYEFENGKPIKNLVPENILVSSPGEPGTLSVNLSDYKIVTDKDVLLTLEWVEAVSLDENEIQNVSFRSDRTRRNANVYLKSTSHAPFMKIDQFIKYHLGFYVTARQTNSRH